MSSDLKGARVLVVGASAGVGRAIATQAIGAGADVVVAARRPNLLESLVEDAGGGRVVAADLCDAGDCRRLAARAGELLGAIDLVLFCAGVAALRPIEQQQHEDWTHAFAVNVIGVNLTIAELLPMLAPRALVAALSSESVGKPHWGLGPYGASKAALEESFRCWRAEHPELRFVTIPLGPTGPTDFAVGFDPSLLAEADARRAAAGVVYEKLMDTDEVAAAILGALGALLPLPGVGVQHLALLSVH